MNRNYLKIKNSKGNYLYGSLELPPNQHPDHYAIFAHCFTCGKDLNAVRNISLALTEAGIGVVRFDFTGLGQSDGQFKESYFSANVADLIDVHRFLEDDGKKVDLLVGHSLGGAAVIAAATQLPDVKAVATIGAPSDIRHTTKHFSSGSFESDSDFKVSIGGRPFIIDKQFIDDFTSVDLLEYVPNIKASLLVLHSPEDEIVNIEHAQTIYETAKHPKSFISLSGANHLLTEQNDSEYIGGVIAQWSKRYLPKVDNKLLKTEDYSVVGHLDQAVSNFTTLIQTGKHKLKADEPIEHGGNDFGPSPYEILQSSLIACTAITVKMYANRKGWPLEEVYVYTTHEKVNDPDGGSRKIDVVHNKVKFEGDLTEKQINRLFEISKKCPVHLSLTRSIQINQSL